MTCQFENLFSLSFSQWFMACSPCFLCLLNLCICFLLWAFPLQHLLVPLIQALSLFFCNTPKALVIRPAASTMHKASSSKAIIRLLCSPVCRDARDAAQKQHPVVSPAAGHSLPHCDSLFLLKISPIWVKPPTLCKLVNGLSPVHQKLVEGSLPCHF